MGRLDSAKCSMGIRIKIDDLVSQITEDNWDDICEFLGQDGFIEDENGGWDDALHSCKAELDTLSSTFWRQSALHKKEITQDQKSETPAQENGGTTRIVVCASSSNTATDHDDQDVSEPTTKRQKTPVCELKSQLQNLFQNQGELRPDKKVSRDEGGDGSDAEIPEESVWGQRLLIPHTTLLQSDRWGHNRVGCTGISRLPPDLKAISDNVQRQYAWLSKYEVVLIQQQDAS
jgi:hypothetical protein